MQRQVGVNYQNQNIKKMANQIVVLSAEKFEEIYTDRKFLVQVTTAGKCLDQFGMFKHLKTCSYPIEYIVTENQKEVANLEMDRQIKEKLIQIKTNNTLTFVGLGMAYESCYIGDVCNHRIRAYFKNGRGRMFMVEFGHTGGRTYCSYSIDTDLEMKRKSEVFSSQKQDYYNFADLEMKRDLGVYNLKNILEIVNSNFGTNFSAIEVNSDILRGEQFLSESI